MVDTNKLKEVAGSLVPKYELKLAVLFGSQARGDDSAQSDIDVGIVSDKELTSLEVGEIASVFSRAVGSQVEVSRIDQMSPLYQRGVVEDGILLYEKELGWFDRFAVYVYSLYWDSKKLLELRRQYLHSL